MADDTPQPPYEMPGIPPRYRDTPFAELPAGLQKRVLAQVPPADAIT